MTILKYNSINYNIVYVDPSIETAGDGSGLAGLCFHVAGGVCGLRCGHAVCAEFHPDVVQKVKRKAERLVAFPLFVSLINYRLAP